jgi:acetyl esterase/lipase
MNSLNRLFSVALSLVSSAGCASLSTVTYRSSDKIAKTVDIYQPQTVSNKPKPAVIVLHGGGWVRRSGDMAFICSRLAREGFIALNATYGLAPDERYPQAPNDVRALVAWVHENADRYGIDRDRIYMWGYSAGGHLALLTGLDPQLKIRGIVAGGAPTDLTVYPRSPLVLSFMGVPLAGNEELWKQASPIFAVQKNSPPVFLYHGGWDVLVEPDQMNRMARKLRESGVYVQTHTASGLGHIGVYLLNSASIEKAIYFLKNGETESPSYIYL